jgi:hypothetical protein
MKRALVVGIDDYQQVSSLNGCVADAVSIRSLLERDGDGSPNFAVQQLTSDSTTVTQAVLREGVDKLFADECDAALLYFSGHGLLDATGGRLVTSDARKYDEGLSMTDVLACTNASKARNKIIILDCCHSGVFGALPVVGSDAAAIVPGVSILAASRDTQAAMEVKGHGVFTSLLLDALGGGASDLRGHVTPGSLYAYVDEALGAWDQRPVFKTNVSTSAVIRKVVPRVAPEIIRQITDLFADPAQEFALDPSFEDTESAAIEENVAKFKVLQKYVGLGLVVPVDEEHMYYAAMNSKACRLTAMGAQYWRLVKEGKL